MAAIYEWVIDISLAVASAAAAGSMALLVTGLFDIFSKRIIHRHRTYPS